MKQYRLLKDLPDYVAGSLIGIPPEENMIIIGGAKKYGEISKFVRVHLNNSEWFEEIIEPEAPKSWEELENVSGYYFDEDADIVKVESRPVDRCFSEGVFATKEQAEGVLAMAKLSQLMKHPVYNGDWRPDWTSDYIKPCIVFYKGVVKTVGSDGAQFLAFKSAKIRGKFLENHRDLIEEYFKIYK